MKNKWMSRLLAAGMALCMVGTLIPESHLTALAQNERALQQEESSRQGDILEQGGNSEPAEQQAGEDGSKEVDLKQEVNPGKEQPENTEEETKQPENTEEETKQPENAEGETKQPKDGEAEEDPKRMLKEQLGMLDEEANPAEAAELKQKLLEQPRARYSNSMLVNEYLEIAADDEGVFTIGTVEGNPSYTTDNNKKLLFGHPSPGTSETLLYIDGREHFFYADSVSRTDNAIIATMKLSEYGILVNETLSFYTNQGTGRDDTVKISYSVSNISGESHQVGIRIMLDTMLADNDHAPFKIAGYGNVTEAKELSGSQITQTYQVYDNLDAPSTMASGTLWLGNDRHPDKVQYCNWGRIEGSSWNHSVEDGDYLGDSAVGIYYNPIAIAPGANMAVSTYYGTGIGISGSGASSIPIDDRIGEDEFDIYLMDSKTGRAVSAATVTLEGIGAAAANGRGQARFEGISPDKNGTVVKAKVQHADYLEKDLEIEIVLGACRTISLKGINDTQPMVESVRMTSEKSEYNNVDLLASTVYFNSNPSNVEATDKNTQEVKIHAVSDMEDCVFQLISDGKAVMENDTGEFTLKTLTNDNAGKTFTTNRLCDFTEGNKIYLQVVSNTGEVSAKTLLGIKVSAPSSYATTLKSDLSFTQTISLSGLEDAAEILKILLGTEDIDFGPSKLPLEVEIDESGKIKVAYNKEPGKDWESFKGDYQQAVLNRSSAGKVFGGNPGSFGTGKAKVEMQVGGYGEGYLEDGKLNINLGVVGTVSGSANYTHTFFIGWVPLYITVGAKAEASLEGQMSVVNEGALSIQVKEGKFEPAISLSAELGVGASGVLSAGVQGKGTLKYTADFSRDYYTLTLKGSASIEVHALLYSNSLTLAEKTWTLYDSNSPRMQAVSSQAKERIYRGDAFEFTPRDYQNTAKAKSMAREEWNSGIYVDAKPVMVKTPANECYRFWIHDDKERTDINRTALVYSKYNSQSQSWSSPVIMADDGTADYNFDVSVSGDDIYVAYQEASKVYTEEDYQRLQEAGSEAGIEEMAKDSVVSMVRLHTSDDTVTDLGTVSGKMPANQGALSPRISVSGSQAFVAWYANSENDILAAKENAENKIYYANMAVGASVTTLPEPELKYFSVGNYALTSMDAGILSGEEQIAYVLDTDRNLETVADRELYLAAGLSTGNQASVKITKETSNISMDESPMFAKIGGTDSLVWYEAGNYYYTSSDASQAKTIFDENSLPVNANNAYAVLEDGTDTAIVWHASGSKSTEENNYSSLYGTRLTGNGWSKPYEIASLSEEESPMIFSLSGYLQEGMCHVSYALKKYEGESLVRSSLCGVQEESRKEAVLTALDYDSNQAASGQAMEWRVSVKNTGTSLIENAWISGLDEDIPIENMALAPGEEKEYTVLAELPFMDGGYEYEIGITLHGEGEAYGAFPMHAGYTDVSVEEKEPVIGGNKEYRAFEITNNSLVPAENVSFKLLLDDEENGAVAYDYTFTEALEGQESCTLLCASDVLEAGAVAYERLTTATDEILLENNKGLVCINVEKPDVIIENRLRVQSAEETAGEVVLGEGFVYQDNGYEKICSTNERIEVQAVPKEGYAFTGWKIAGKGMIEEKHNPQTVFYMSDETATLTAGFATKKILTGITLPESLELKAGGTYEFSPVLAPADTSDYLIWTSSDEGVVKVDEDGKVKAVGAGTAEVKAASSSDDTVYAVCRISVQEVMLERLRMVFPNLNIAGIGVEEELRILKFPADATEKVIFTSDHPEYVSVDENGVIRTAAPGTAVITAKGEQTGVASSCTVTVTNPLVGIYFTNNILNLLRNETKEAAYIENPANTTDNPSPEEIVWHCTDSSVAEITPSADHRKIAVKALKKGTAVVSVDIRDEYHAEFVVVVESLIEEVTLDKTEIRIKKGTTKRLYYEIAPEDASGEVYWKSSDRNIASVDSRGFVTGKGIGTAQVTAISDTGHSASCKVIVYQDTPEKISIEGAEISVSSCTYSGKARTPAVAVRVQGKTLVKNKDYSLQYRNNKNAGKATVIVTGTGNYTGTKEAGFQIKPFMLTGKCVAGVYNQGYTGKAISVKPVVTVSKKKLKKNVDYKLSCKNNKKIGKNAVVTVTGIGNYTGRVSKKFAIVKKKNVISKKNTKISSVSSKTYTGKAWKPKLTVKRNGKKFSAKNYEVVYQNTKNVGKAKITIHGKGAYAGSISISFRILPKPAKFSALKSKKAGTVTVTCQSGTEASGCEIYYKTSKKGKYKLAGKTSKKTYTIKKLKKGSFCYVKVRSWKKVGKAVYYSAYSKERKVKVK